MKHFFISYNQADRRWAEWIAWQLEQAGYTTIVQAWDFRPGSDFVLDMHKAASEAERTIAVLSPDYLTAHFTQSEWSAAFAKGALVPVRVRECEPKGLLPNIVYIDLVDRDESGAKNELLLGVMQGRNKPSTEPRFPGTSTSAVDAPRFPGALPKICNVRHPRNLNFTGREEILAQLRKALTSGPAAITQAISGLGGVGKTQLAVEYIYRHAADYSIAWWVRAEDAATMAGDYAELAVRLNLPEKDAADRMSTVAAVRLWLARNPAWLLILDNASSPAECRDYLPLGGMGHVLVTSRDPNWGALAHPLPLDVLPRDEAIAFLQKRVGQQDGKSADRLCRELGDLPLALEQAGAYIEATGMSIVDYLILFQSRAMDLLKGPVATTWQISFDRMREEAPAAIEVLNLMAFLAPDDIDRELVRGATVPDPIAFNAAVAELRRYSLVQIRDGALSVHRLVQAVTRDRLTAENTAATWAETAVRLVNDAFPFDIDVVETWSRSARLLPHALAVCKSAEELGVALQTTSRLLNQAGLYLRSRAQLANAARRPRSQSMRRSTAPTIPRSPFLPTTSDNFCGIKGIWKEHCGTRNARCPSMRRSTAPITPRWPSVPTTSERFCRSRGIQEERCPTCNARCPSMKRPMAPTTPMSPSVPTTSDRF